MRKSTWERFWEKVDVQGPDDCWYWTAHIQTATGYGKFTYRGESERAYRVSYELEHGTLSLVGLSVDHVCHTRDRTCAGGRTCPHRACVNPAHLEAVPMAENKARGMNVQAINKRKTHCKRGHRFTSANTIVRALGRECRTCHRQWQAAYYHRKQQALLVN